MKTNDEYYRHISTISTFNADLVNQVSKINHRPFDLLQLTYFKELWLQTVSMYYVNDKLL